jgi:hypothetical protein
MNWFYLSILVTVAMSTAQADEPPKPKGNFQLQVLTATAVENDGSATVTLWVPSYAFVIAQVEIGGVPTNYTKMKFKQWRSVEIKVDEKDVRAYSTNGKPLTAKRLATLLSKATPVAVFDDAADPAALKLLREDTVVLTIPTILLAEPPKPDDKSSIR